MKQDEEIKNQQMGSVMIIKHLDLKLQKIIKVRREQIREGGILLYRILVSLFLSEFEDQCDLIG